MDFYISVLKYSRTLGLWDVIASYKNVVKGHLGTQAVALYLSRTWPVFGFSIVQIVLEAKHLNLWSLNALILFLKLDQLEFIHQNTHKSRIWKVVFRHLFNSTSWYLFHLYVSDDQRQVQEA